MYNEETFKASIKDLSPKSLLKVLDKIDTMTDDLIAKKKGSLKEILALHERCTKIVNDVFMAHHDTQTVIAENN